MAKVMIVDDSKFMRKVLKDYICLAGHEIITESKNGLEAIANYQLYKPDLVMMDITMPIVDGISTLKHLLSIDSKAKIIMSSATGNTETIVDGIKAGAKDFLIRPFNHRQISEMLQTALT